MAENSSQPNQTGKIVNIIGGTGLIGLHLVKQLSENPDIEKVNVFLRKKTNLSMPKVEEHVIDFENAETFKKLINGDALFCCLGSTIKKAGSQEAFKKVDFNYPLTFAEIAKTNGIDTYMIVTAIGANPNSSIFYNRVKGEVEEALKKLNFRQLFIFRPSFLLGKRKEVRIGEKMAAGFFRFFNFLFIGPLKKYQPIPGELVATSMLDKLDEKSAGVFIFESDEI